MRLFISYAHQDENMVRQLACILHKAGHDPWFDQESLVGGPPCQEQYHNAMRHCDAFIYALTPTAKESDLCQQDFFTAIELGKPIIPVLLKTTTLPALLGRHQFANFTEGFGGKANVRRFLHNLDALATNMRLEDALKAATEPQALTSYALTLNRYGQVSDVSNWQAQIYQVVPQFLGQKNTDRVLYGIITLIVLISIIIARSALVSDEQRFDMSLVRANLAPVQYTVSGRAATYINRGVTSYHQGDLDSAIAYLSHAIELDPDYAKAYCIRGAAYYSHGDLDSAFANFTRAIELDPHYAAAYNNRGVVYFHQGDPGRAIANYTRAIELDPYYAAAYNNRGGVYFRQGNLGLAIADLNRAIELDPYDADAYYNRRNVYQKLGKYDLASADYNRAIELDRHYAKGYIGRRNIY